MNTCQVCGNTIFNKSYMSHNADGSVNYDFCSACFKNGHFTSDLGEGDGPGILFPLAFDNVVNDRTF